MTTNFLLIQMTRRNLDCIIFLSLLSRFIIKILRKFVTILNSVSVSQCNKFSINFRCTYVVRKPTHTATHILMPLDNILKTKI